MLNSEQNALITENINLVYKFCAQYNIKDEDDIADLVAYFCELINKNAYDNTKGRLSTFVWNSLNNYQHYKHNTKKALKRNLPDDMTRIYLNKCLMHGEQDTEVQDLISISNDVFGEAELEVVIDKIRMMAKRKDDKRKFKRTISNEEMLNAVLYYYEYENGETNITEIARKFNTTKQNASNFLAELRKDAWRYLHDD